VPTVVPNKDKTRNIIFMEKFDSKNGAIEQVICPIKIKAIKQLQIFYH